jgi:hypothetical protein
MLGVPSKSSGPKLMQAIIPFGVVFAALLVISRSGRKKKRRR